MFNDFNKEIVVKRTLKMRWLDALLNGSVYTIILYFCLTKYNEDIVEFMRSVAENNLALQVTLILFPLIVFGTGFIWITSAIVNSDSTSAKKKNKKSKKN